LLLLDWCWLAIGLAYVFYQSDPLIERVHDGQPLFI